MVQGEGEPAESVGSQTDALSADGMERIIPLRFIRMLESAGDQNNADLNSILRTVEYATPQLRASALGRAVLPTGWHLEHHDEPSGLCQREFL